MCNMYAIEGIHPESILYDGYYQQSGPRGLHTAGRWYGLGGGRRGEGVWLEIFYYACFGCGGPRLTNTDLGFRDGV